MKKIEIGSHVWFNVSSEYNPEMIVKSIDSNGICVCVWFVKGFVPKEHSFHKTSLITAQPEFKKHEAKGRLIQKFGDIIDE